MNLQFDKRFLEETPLIYTKEHFDHWEIKVYQQPQEIIGSSSGIARLSKDYIGSYITIDRDGFLHSYNDRPALITQSQDLYWYKHGRLHRDINPAIIRPKKEMIWYKNGKIHRDDGPAYIYLEGSMVWYRNGISHRRDGPAVIFSEGSIEWRKNGEPYRYNGPAVIKSNGDFLWFKNGRPLKLI